MKRFDYFKQNKIKLTSFILMRGYREDEGALASSWWEDVALVIFSFLEVNNNVTHLPYIAQEHNSLT
jgi:hypothetical protein